MFSDTGEFNTRTGLSDYITFDVAKHYLQSHKCYKTSGNCVETYYCNLKT